MGRDDHLGGWCEGEGTRVLLMHGGPGLSFDYLDPMADDIGDGYAIASYQQRGLAPSTTSLSSGVAEEADDAVRVLDHLGWDRAYVIGHSWGGHLLLHLALAHPERLHGGLAVDPLGGVGDGGLAAFGAEMMRRASDDDRTRAEEIDAQVARDGQSDELMLAHLAAMWPSYFASPADAPSMPPIRVRAAAYETVFASVLAGLGDLEANLPKIAVPLGFAVGAASPIPVDASKATAARIPGAWVEIVAGAGHFIWHEAPGSVRSALDRLVQS